MAEDSLNAKGLGKVGEILTRKSDTEKEQEDLRNRERPERSSLLILHYSDFKTHWDWVVLALTYYTAVVVPLVAAFHITNRSIAWILTDTIVDLFFIADVVVTCYTTRAGAEGEIVTDLKNIRINYLKSWLILDVLTCIPYDAISWLAGNVKGNARLLSIMKACRLCRLIRIARDLDRYLAQTYASLLVLVSLILLLCHWLGCGWYNVALVDAASYIKSLPNVTEGTKNNIITTSSTVFEGPAKNLIFPEDGFVERKDYILDETKMMSEWQSVHKRRHVSGNYSLESQIVIEDDVHDSKNSAPKNWLVRLGEQRQSEFFWNSSKAIVSQGFGNIYGETHNEQVYCIFVLLVGGLIYALILANVTTAMESITASEEQLQDTMTSIRNFSKLYEVPRRLQDSMLDYVYFSWTATHGISDKKVLDWLPEHMRLDASVYLHRHVMTTQPTFISLSETSTRHIASKMERIHTAPGDILVDRGEEIKHIFFVVSGSLEIIQSGQIVGLVGTCDSFGATFWCPSSRRNGCLVSETTVKALTYVDLEIIRGEDVIGAMKLYSDIQRTFFRKFKLTFDLTKKMSFDTVQAVQWAKKVNEDPEIAKKDRRLKKWMEKIRGKKSKVAPENVPEEKNIQSERPKTSALTEAPGEEGRATSSANDSGQKLKTAAKNIVNLIPLSMPVEEYYRNQPDLTVKGGGFRSETITSATIYEVSLNDDGTTVMDRLPEIMFSLDRLEWMDMELPTEIKEILLAVLKMKMDGMCQIESLNERLDKCEKSLTKITELVEKLYAKSVQ